MASGPYPDAGLAAGQPGRGHPEAEATWDAQANLGMGGSRLQAAGPRLSGESAAAASRQHGASDNDAEAARCPARQAGRPPGGAQTLRLVEGEQALMTIPQVADQLKRAPTMALRAVFAGVGRILMAADRPQPTAAPAAAQQGTSAVSDSRWRSLDQTGNVRLLSAEDRDATPATPTAPSSGVPASAAGLAVIALPLPRYDELSLASIRARLRSLDAGQLRVLADYERTNAERPEVLGMLERRIEKLEAAECR